MRKRIALLCAVIFAMLFLLEVPMAMAAAKPKSIALSVKSATIDMAEKRTLQLSATVQPSNASQSVEWKSSNKKIATVSKKGLVTAKKTGRVTIYARPKNVNKIVKCTLVIKDSSKPTSISLPKSTVTISVGETVSLAATVNPKTADQGVKWSSNKKTIAKVSTDGVITGVKAGSAKITVTSTKLSSVKRTITVKVQKKPAPKQILLTPATAKMNISETLQLVATAVPDTASASVGYASSNKKIATVSSAGVVKALREGSVTITVTSKDKKTVKATCKLTIVDPNKITGVSIVQSDMYLGLKDTVVLRAELKPAGATSDVSWSTSNSGVVQVTSAGKITALKPGEATIQVKTAIGGYTAKVLVTVLDTNRTTDLPVLTSTVSQITQNLAKIDAIRLSANNELTALVAAGTITSAAAERRKQAIINAFAMYRFPWMTEAAQPYWSTDAASKAYKTGLVYYGMPYIQTARDQSYLNRRYNAALAISGGYFTANKNGYYLMSQTQKLRNMYVGSDCSSFVSMSIWGTSHPASYLNTKAMAVSIYYKPITASNEMMPGDVLVKSGVHTVMFLYYTNAAKTQMMIIEQGGGTEPNTVACRVKSVLNYTANGYVIRRPTSF